MPRKPKLAIPDLHIEGLSGSAADTVPTFMDDFGPEMIPMKPEGITNRRKRVRALKLVKRKAFAMSYVEQRNAAMELIKQRMQSTLRSPAKPGEQSITLGPNLVIIVPAKPWRRL